jgi:hypothetical protein
MEIAIDEIIEKEAKMLVNHGLFLMLLPLVFFINNKPLL